MQKVDKALVISTSKEVLLRALLPNAILVPFVVLLHWIIITIWYSYNYDQQDIWTNMAIGLLGGSFTVVTYFFWGLRRFLIKAYLIIHHNIIQLWLHPFCKKMADRILHGDLMGELELNEGSLSKEWSRYLKEKSNDLPPLIKKIFRRVLRKVGYTDTLERNIKLVINKDSNEIANLIHDEVGYQLIKASNSLVPAKIIYIIPINIILMILLWFI